MSRYMLDTIRFALEFENAPVEDPGDLASALVAIAEHRQIPVSEILLWVHTKTPDKEWTLAEFRGWCDRFEIVRQREKVR